MHISANIGAIKRHHNMAIFQPERWQQVLQQQVEAGQRLGLDPQFVKDITEKIHGESIRLQNETQ
jgi:chorismate mutase